MSNIVDGLYYTESHEWARVRDDGQIEIGITDHAQDSLGDIVYLELPAEGSAVKRGEPFGVVESVKTLSDLYAPISGTVAAVNAELADTPEKVNEEPYGAGWLLRIAPSDDATEALSALLDAAGYRATLGE